MSKKLNVKVNGKNFEVEVSDFSGSLAEVTVNGKPYSIEIEEAGATQSPPIAAPAVQSAAPAPIRPVTPAPAVAIASAGAEDVISAPMPGVIMDIKVKAGDKITAGTVVCALEAMKMKNLIRSQRDGTVASVEVSEGQRVPFGAVIIRFA